MDGFSALLVGRGDAGMKGYGELAIGGKSFSALLVGRGDAGAAAETLVKGVPVFQCPLGWAG